MKQKIFNITGTVICIILSMAFVLMSVVLPFYYSITALTKPKTITEIVQSIDYKTVIKKTTVIETVLKQNGINAQKAEEFMKSKEAGEIIEIYTDETKDILLNIPNDKMIDVPLIKELAEENLDDFVKIAEENTGKNFSEKKIKKNVDTFIEKNERQIEEAIPVIETTRKVVKTVHESEVAQKTLSTKFIIALVAVGIVFMALIILMKKNNGFIWLCINCMISSLLLATVLVFAQSDFMGKMALKLSDFNVEIIESAVSVCSEKIAIAFGISSLSTFLFIIIFIAIKGIQKKKNQPLAKSSKLEPVTLTETDVSDELPEEGLKEDSQ